jgi:hypothetical protein
MNITIENLELSVDSEVLIDEIRDEITTLIEDAVAEYLRYNFDIEDHIDYDDVADEVNRRTETRLTIAQLNDMLDSASVRDHLMMILAEQIVLGTPFKVLQKLD